ncbi:YchE family NAAT transporter [Pasteurella atlantica]|uniref:YchE family NAAT transporter n=3 Tax=Pasteurellaceae TaxID=712 RepID=A0ACC6HMJ1_9PAST|nr:YchE family NAAT transporter [Pasteurella atlantica]MBR0574516.1 YchE family NAAT transporter [Pasteurella atlantica]MDP8033492.1 YchE family NAAT transporter [Pasteurella atlantica]MDP8035428.1 YchE family NAAT transporter [Pasteurella atlantica]MDP8037379.1 YchE family NAAT transporter [Pasteurella atlantica]MDP8040383.1 YchE family NAAT transporter [Pasteurella atlantica]
MEIVFHFSIYLQFFIGLFAVVNPVGFLPIFYSMTEHQYEAERNHTTFVTSISVCMILLVSLFFGKLILDAFSISLDSFRVAGGFLITTIAITMINGKLGEHKQNKEERNTDVSEYDNIGVVPLAMPMMAGPGAIGSTIVWGSNHHQWTDYIGFSLAIIAFAIICYISLRFSAPVVKKLGKTGTNVITRIMGLILMSLGIEFIVNGLGNIFPSLVNV